MSTSGIWSCKIGKIDQEKLPNGADWPMRQAVAEAFRKLTGEEPEFIFSGWNSELTEAEEECLKRSDKIREEQKRTFSKEDKPQKEQRDIFSVYVMYDGGLDREKDKAIEEAVGREFLSSGCCMFGKRTRDLQFDFFSGQEAEEAAKRLQNSSLDVRIKMSWR